MLLEGAILAVQREWRCRHATVGPTVQIAEAGTRDFRLLGESAKMGIRSNPPA
jgi:hypothetical protein